VLITTDQQRFDTYGDEKPDFLRTPHMDWLADDGIRFRRAYASCPVCQAARAGYMTGNTTYTHRMGVNGPTCDYFGREDTLPTLMREAGYQTCAIGKLHFHPQHIRHGFDETHTLDEYYRMMRRSGHPRQPRRHGIGENELAAGMACVPESMTLTSWISEQAVDFITERRDPTMPFFLWVSYSKPHMPLDPPEPYYSMYRDCEMPEPWGGDWHEAPDRPESVMSAQYGHNLWDLPRAQLDAIKAAYYGLITQIDYNMGRVFAALQDTGCYFSGQDNTLILFCSDHGELLGDHRMGSKGTPFEPSARVPMILRLPRTWQERHVGRRCDEVVCHADILPTLVGAVGGRVPDGLDGVSMLDVVRGQAEPHEYVVCGAGHSQKSPATCWCCIHDGRWKYSWYYAGGVEHLFDLQEDPREEHNLAGAPEHADKKQELRAELEAYLATKDGPYLEDGKLFGTPRPEKTEAERRAAGFPGYMLDTHKADALH
jgi:arylsulfatase A-like enzyme